jgi:hypothetical protein
MKVVKVTTGEYGRPRSRVLLFINLQNETILESIQNRNRRPYEVYRKEVLPQVMTGKLKGVKASWSQYAGCSCGCSPGFILNINPFSVGYDAIWAEVK